MLKNKNNLNFYCTFNFIYIFICKYNVNMKRKIINNRLLNIRMSEKLYSDYKNYCELNGLLLSKRIRFLMQKDIDNKIKIDQ